MINRRQFLRIAAVAGLAVQSGCARFVNSATQSSRKKGLGLTTKTDEWRRKLESIRPQWTYSWGSAKPESTPGGVEFVPMVWGYRNPENFLSDLTNVKSSGSRSVLCFNEPDGKKQGNVSVDAAIKAWPALMESGLRLGSPACVHPDNAWMVEFMKRAAALNYRVDFVCVHSYGGPNVAELVKKLTQTHERYGKPLWITEFAVGDWKAKSVAEHRNPAANVLAFMKECLPALDELNFLERYAWFSAAITSAPLGTSALFNPDNSLTPLGEFYANH